MSAKRIIPSIYRDWLWSASALRAYVHLVLALLVGVIAFRVSSPGSFLGVLLVLAIIGLVRRPLVYFVILPLIMLSAVSLAKWRGETAQYPCPVCGYDIRATPHRCPECGAKLRWGYLVK